MKIFYRISDNSYPKIKLPGATKQFCLRNFLESFAETDMTIIADNCLPATNLWITEIVPQAEHVISNLSNAGSFVLALNKALELPDEELVYFVEDDYLHHGNNLQQIIEDGLSFFDYVTLFDHPDKYESEYNFGEQCVVKKINHQHWRTTISTCMTFATKVKTLRKDVLTWLKWTSGNHPHDHMIFVELLQQGSNLGVCIPGKAFHVDLTYQFSKSKIDELIEPWVIQVLQTALLGTQPNLYPEITGFKKLALLETLNKKSPI